MTEDANDQTLSERVAEVRTAREKTTLTVKPPVPVNMMVELSNACNHACIFCANPHMQRKIGRVDPDLLDRVMVEAVDLGVKEIGFYATGEPLVHRDLERFVARAQEIGYSYIYISTNGAVGGPPRFQRLLDAGLNSIKFSINAGSRETYKTVHGKDDWDKVIENLKFCVQYRRETGKKFKIYITFVITRLTAHEVESFRAAFADDVDEIFFNQSDAQQGNMAGAQELYGYREYAFHSGGGICPLPFNRIHITCEGYLTLCCVDYQNYLAVADLREMTLAEAWWSDAFVAARKRHLDNDLLGTLCGNCWLGRQDKIDPLDPEKASLVDFDSFYQRQREKVKERLIAQTDAAKLSLPDS